MKRRRSPQLLHPLTLASYPALALYVANADQIEPSSMLRSWLASIALAVLLLATFRLVYRDAAKGALAASLSQIAFFAYGHLYAELKQLGPLAAALIRHRYFLPLVLGLLALALLWIRRLADAAGLQRLFSAAGVALLVLPLVRLGYFQLESARMRSSASSSGAGCTLRPPEDAQLPDIYLVIMDAYERDDVLWEMHGYDNTPFLRELELRGFYVARGSLSNYRHTELSVTSLLNLDYIQSFPESYSPESQNRVGLIELLKHSRLRRELECLGYSTVTLETGAVWTEWRDADYFISREAGVLHQLQFLGGLTRFESFLLRSTMARAALDLSTQLASPETALSNDPVERTRERILFEFDQLEQVPALPGPKLVFVHIISPHPPFVFGPNGEYVSKAEFETDSSGRPLERTLLDAYADQVQYLNGRLLSAVDRILAGSGVPPVIIIQGDHGWAERNAEDKLSILNVYYFPDGDYSDLYPTITPVNSFRVVLNRYLGGNFELLEDVSYFSTEEDVFRFEVVENRWESQEGP